MSIWHVWGTYGLVEPKHVGEARRVDKGDRAARKTAEANGFPWDEKCRNGFTPWASTFESSGDDQSLERAFANHPIILGWRRMH